MSFATADKTNLDVDTMLLKSNCVLSEPVGGTFHVPEGSGSCGPVLVLGLGTHFSKQFCIINGPSVIQRPNIDGAYPVEVQNK